MLAREIWQTSPPLADPVEMIALGAPRVIHTEEELAECTEVLFNLTALEEPTRDQIEAVQLPSLSVFFYEEEHYPLPKATPERVVRFGVRLVPYLKSEMGSPAQSQSLFVYANVFDDGVCQQSLSYAL